MMPWQHLSKSLGGSGFEFPIQMYGEPSLLNLPEFPLHPLVALLELQRWGRIFCLRLQTEIREKED